MTSFTEFITQENLEKMSEQELMNLWSFLLSDHNVLYLVDRIKERLDILSNKKKGV